MNISFSGDSLFSSLEAGYLEQCANNLKVVLIAADTPNQVCIFFMKISKKSFTYFISNIFLGNDRRFSASR